jgi:glycosyltransferase involved in cell wall biosynthesis
MSRIALLIPDLEAGGAQRVMLILARKFVSEGHQVDLVVLRASGPLQSDVPPNVSLVKLNAAPNYLGALGFGLSSIRRLGAWLKRAHPDAMLSTISGTNLAAIIARRLSGLPVRLVIRQSGSVRQSGSTLRHALLRLLYPYADAVIALTPAMARDIANKLRVPSKKVHCLVNPIDPTMLLNLSEAPIGHPWFDDHACPVIIAVGRLVPEKDYETLLHAFAILAGKVACRLFIVGDGPEQSRLVRLAHELQIEHSVEFFGFDQNPWRWMARAKSFVLSSRFEGMPNSALEATFLGLPIVITDYDLSFELSTKSNVLVVPSGDPQSLADALEKSLTLPRIASNMPVISTNMLEMNIYEFYVTEFHKPSI